MQNQDLNGPKMPVYSAYERKEGSLYDCLKMADKDRQEKEKKNLKESEPQKSKKPERVRFMYKGKEGRLYDLMLLAEKDRLKEKKHRPELQNPELG